MNTWRGARSTEDGEGQAPAKWMMILTGLSLGHPTLQPHSPGSPLTTDHLLLLLVVRAAVLCSAHTL